MDLEETKRIIESKIEAEALTKNVRRQIKSYIHEKQNLREGFKETFKPLIKSQDKIKESIDKQQNAIIKQLQENQLALTEGLDKNRLAITQGFDKMDDVKKWDLQQLPGYEAIKEEKKSESSEEPEEISVAEEPIIYKISHRDLNKIMGEDMYPDDDHPVQMNKKDLLKIYDQSPNKNKYKVMFNKITGEVKVINKPITLPYGKSDMDEYLIYKKSTQIFYNLKDLNFQVIIRTKV